MKSLLRAVRFALVSDAAIMAANTGGVFTGRALDTASLPYLVASGLSGFPPVYTTTRTIQIDHMTVRFQAWSESVDEALTTVQRVESIFRAANPVLDSGTVICVTKGSDGIEIDPDPTDSGHDVYMGIIDMEFTVQRDPTT